jgi:phosphatidylglycerol:prolipoprotein diacylglycerol transferase
MSPIAAMKLWKGPFHVGGGIIGLLLAAPLVTRAFGMKLGQFADGIVPSIGLGLAIVRIGCFMQGCCFGDVCHYPWCIAYPPGSDVFTTHQQVGLVAAADAHSLPVHPLHLYFLVAGLVVAAVSLTAHRYKRYDGQPALLGLLAFTVALAVLEFWRTDEGVRIYWGPLPQLEWTALALVAVVVTMLGVAELKHRRRHRPEVPVIAAGLSAVRG